MPKYAVEQFFNGSIPVEKTTYDPYKINLLGEHLSLYNLGTTDIDKFLGPKLTKVIRFSDITAPTVSNIHVLEYGSNLHYIFLGIAPAASAIRQFAVYTYNRLTEEVGGGGLTTVTLPTTTSHTLRGIRPSLKFYTAGSVSVNGNIVTGVGTAWITDRMCVGSRIGFGSTDSSEITTWYEIASIDTETQITLTSEVGFLDLNTQYVIEDLRIGLVTTNATLPNGGMFICKGLRLDGLIGGLVIPAATTIDNIRACYKLNDAVTNTYTIASGITAGEFVSWQEEYMYGLNNTTTTTLKFYKVNIRAALSLSAGQATLSSTDCIQTGSQAISGGTLQVTNNGRYAIAQHGPGNNIPSIYVSCTNRIMRADVADITSGSTSFFKDQMIEVTPGGITNLPLTNNLLFADYTGVLDKFVVSAYTAPNGRIYVTDYKSDGSQMDLSMGLVWNSFDGISSSNVIFPKLQAQAPLVWVQNGILYLFNSGTTPAGQGYIYPAFAAHWSFVSETNNLAILPKITMTGIPTRFNNVYINKQEYIEANNENDKTLEPIELFYRTEGIDDNSGSWSPVSKTGSLRTIEPTTEIQFAIAFRTMGDICIPARVFSLSLVYEAADALPDEYQWNLGDSNILDGTFGFTQVNLFTSWPLNHIIRIYRADNNTLALEQNSDNTTLGVFEYWNGSNWIQGLGENLVTTRRRFRPTSSLPGGIDLYAILAIDTL